MPGVMLPEDQEKRLLVFNCHEPWVYQLRGLGMAMDIVMDLPGRYGRGWDLRMRPVPAHSRLIDLQRALDYTGTYDCIITHNVRDLLDIKTRPEPRLMMLHISLQARLVEEAAPQNPQHYQHLLRTYTNQIGVQLVAVTAAKGQSWGCSHEVVQAGVDTADFLPHTGQRACGLRINNFIMRRQRFVHWDFHRAAFAGLPVRLVGHNPGLSEAAPSRDWDHLRQLLSEHRFLIHTASPELEDGFNMAVLEGMAAGLPVLGNKHPTSPVEHGVSGFLSDDPLELRHYAQRLLDDQELAQTMGQAARDAIGNQFSSQRFNQGMAHVIALAQRRWQAAKVAC